MKFKEIRIPSCDLPRVYNYICREDADHHVIASNILSGQHLAELGRAASLRPDCPSAFLHWVLAFPEGDLAKLNPALIKSVWRRFFQLMEVPPTCKYVIATHGADMQHSHALLSRVGTDTSIWLARFTVRKGIKATEALEKEFGLTITPTLNYSKDQVRRPAFTKHEFELKKRTGLPVRKEVIVGIIEDSLKHSGGAFTLFTKACHEQGLSLQVIERANGSRGLSFTFDSVSYRGSNIGKGYSYGNLMKALAVIEVDKVDKLAPQLPAKEERAENLKHAATLNVLSESASKEQKAEAEFQKRTLVDRLDKLRLECPKELLFEVTLLFYIVTSRLYALKFYSLLKIQVKILEAESVDLLLAKKRDGEMKKREMVR